MIQEPLRQLAAALESFENRFQEWGPSLFLFGVRLRLFADGSGKLIVKLINRDCGSNHLAKLMAALDPIEKEFEFRTSDELQQILDNPRRWQHSEVGA
jgi:hypothetical protein